jgi:hypothetical protein
MTDHVRAVVDAIEAVGGVIIELAQIAGRLPVRPREADPIARLLDRLAGQVSEAAQLLPLGVVGTGSACSVETDVLRGLERVSAHVSAALGQRVDQAFVPEHLDRFARRHPRNTVLLLQVALAGQGIIWRKLARGDLLPNNRGQLHIKSRWAAVIHWHKITLPTLGSSLTAATYHTLHTSDTLFSPNPGAANAVARRSRRGNRSLWRIHAQ